MKDEELKQLAEDVWAGKVFTNAHIEDVSDEELFRICRRIFTPLMLMDTDQLMDLFEVRQAAMIYEYLDKVVSRTIRGYPMFLSFHYITEDEMHKFESYYANAQENDKNV